MEELAYHMSYCTWTWFALFNFTLVYFVCIQKPLFVNETVTEEPGSRVLFGTNVLLNKS